MSLVRGITIDYGGFVMGGSTDYMVHGPTSVHRSFEEVSFSFDIVIAGGLSNIDAIETALRKRDQDLVVTGPSGSWGSYIFGQNALNTKCEITKPGDQDADTGRSRVYTVTFTAGLAADDLGGLREIQSELSYTPARQKIVRFSGQYTALNGATAKQNYESDIDSVTGPILNMIDSGIPWELTDEVVDWDRNNHVLTFTQNFVGIIYEQSASGLDDPRIISSRVVFTRTSAYPGDSSPDTNRPEIITAEYSAYVDIEQAGNDPAALENLYEDSIFPFLKSEFTNTWNPQQYAITTHQRNFIPSTSELFARITFLAYMPGSSLLESTKSEGYQEQRSPDYTPIWDDDELSHYVDRGHMNRMRVTNVTETHLGEKQHRFQLINGDVRPEGWNKVGGSSRTTPQWIGEGADRVQVTLLDETLLERFTNKPGGGTGTTDKPHPDREEGFGGESEASLDRRVRQQADPVTTSGRTVTGGSASAAAGASNPIPQHSPDQSTGKQ